MGLIIIFVVVPLLVVGPVIWFVSWQSRNDTPPLLTSDVLATGEAVQAEILAIRSMGGFLDVRPMVKMTLRVPGPDGDADIEIVQSLPRSLIRDLPPGSIVPVRVAADRSNAALVLAPVPSEE